jgi:hypothetical protein
MPCQTIKLDKASFDLLSATDAKIIKVKEVQEESKLPLQKPTSRYIRKSNNC